jgi:hypothetical protein
MMIILVRDIIVNGNNETILPSYALRIMQTVLENSEKDIRIVG